MLPVTDGAFFQETSAYVRFVEYGKQNIVQKCIVFGVKINGNDVDLYVNMLYMFVWQQDWNQQDIPL